MKEKYIYCLYKNDIPFYVGYTSSLFDRLNKHKKIYGNDILIEELDFGFNYRFLEKYYICLFKSWGFKLSNDNNGGGGPEFQTLVTKNKISLGRKGKKYPKISLSKKGKTHSTKTKLKISQANKGRPKPSFSLETCKKISQNTKGIKKTKEHKLKISQALQGIKRKENTLFKKYKPVIQLDLNNNFIKE